MLRVFIKVSFLNISHTIEIIRVKYVVKHSDIARYTAVTDCAFMNLEGTSVLAIELRKIRYDNAHVKVVVAETRVAGKELLLGFIVNDVHDFYKRLY